MMRDVQVNQSITFKFLSRPITLFAALSAGLGLIFLALTIQRSALPYNSEGNYFDGVVNYHEQSVFVYGFMAGVSFLASFIVVGIRFLVQRKMKRDQLS